MTWVPLDESDVDPSPFVQCRRWFDEAAPLLREPDAIALATSTPDGRPSVRMVLLRHVDDESFGWYTNYESRKGHELDDNPHAALLWYCEPLGRQIRIEGTVTRAEPTASDTYFMSRPRGHQIGAHASDQSKVLTSRQELQRRVSDVQAQFADASVPRPPYWGGYRLTPECFEFWQHREDRLHDRVVYRPVKGGWRRERLAP